MMIKESSKRNGNQNYVLRKLPFKNNVYKRNTMKNLKKRKKSNANVERQSIHYHVKFDCLQ